MAVKKILVVKTQMQTQCQNIELQINLTKLLGEDYYVIVTDLDTQIELIDGDLTTLELGYDI